MKHDLSLIPVLIIALMALSGPSASALVSEAGAGEAPGKAAEGADPRAGADRHYEAVELKEASELYEELVAEQPDDAGLRIRLADCLTRTDRFVEAIEHARHAVSLPDGGAEALAALGKALHRLGDFDAARERLLEGLEKDADCAECLWALARIQAIHGDYIAAGEGLRRAATLQPENPVFVRSVAVYVTDREQQKELYRGYLALPRRDELSVWENARAWLGMLEFVGDRRLRQTEIPEQGTEVRLDVQEGMSYLDVTLGRRKLRYMFDTGASGFTISARTMKRLKLEPVDAYTITGIGGKGKSETKMVLVPEIRVGEAVIRNVPAVVADAGPTTDGLLGPTLFGGASITLDPAHRRLRIGGPADPGYRPAGAGKSEKRKSKDRDRSPLEIPFLSINGTPFIPIQVNGHAMHAMVDTGASQAVLSEYAAGEVPDLEFMAPGLAPPGYREIRGATGTTRDIRVARRASLVYADREVEMAAHLPDRDRVLVSYDLTPLSHGVGTEIWAILGSPQLDDYILTIDWGEQVLRLLPR
jgi:predicted aspartyl protease